MAFFQQNEKAASAFDGCVIDVKRPLGASNNEAALL